MKKLVLQIQYAFNFMRQGLKGNERDGIDCTRLLIKLIIAGNIAQEKCGRPGRPVSHDKMHFIPTSISSPLQFSYELHLHLFFTKV